MEAWSMCDNISVDLLVDAEIMYLCRYHTDKGVTPKGYESTFAFMSRNPGIGACYADNSDSRDYHLCSDDRSFSAPLEDGKTTSLGRYLRKRIYGPDFEVSSPEFERYSEISREERLKIYYAKKAKRRAKLSGKV